MSRRKKKNVEEIPPGSPPMTPMIDVVFQLLIYFMLTLNIRELEAKLLNQLPKNKGLAATLNNNPELQEVRVYLCAKNKPGMGWKKDGREYDIKFHRNDKGGHERLLDNRDGQWARVWVENFEIGDLERSRVTSALGGVENDKDIMAKNQTVYKKIAQKVKELRPPSSQDPTKNAPTLLDACSEVPNEHVIGVLNACKELGIEPIELVGNPRIEQLLPKAPQKK